MGLSRKLVSQSSSTSLLSLKDDSGSIKNVIGSLWCGNNSEKPKSVCYVHAMSSVLLSLPTCLLDALMLRSVDHELTVFSLHWLGHSLVDLGDSPRLSLALSVSPCCTFLLASQPVSSFFQGACFCQAAVDPRAKWLLPTQHPCCQGIMRGSECCPKEWQPSELWGESGLKSGEFCWVGPKGARLEENISSLRSKKCWNLKKEVGFNQPL